MTDEEFAALAQPERDFAIRWVRMTDDEQEGFCRSLLSAIDVLQRLRVLDAPDPPADALPA